jgi:hypothetical protein
MAESMVVNVVGGNAVSFEHMDFISADNVSEKKLKKWVLKNTHKEELQLC